MVIDELALSDEDIKKIIAGETSEMEEILTWLKHNTAMTLAALSSTSLLDRREENDGTDKSKTELEAYNRNKLGLSCKEALKKYGTAFESGKRRSLRLQS